MPTALVLDSGKWTCARSDQVARARRLEDRCRGRYAVLVRQRSGVDQRYPTPQPTWTASSAAWSAPLNATTSTSSLRRLTRRSRFCGRSPISGSARILGGDRASAERATDKVKGLVTADTYGFPTPPWAAPATVDEAVRCSQLTGLPAVVKPRRSYVREDGGLRQRRHDFVREPSKSEPLVRALAEADGTLPLVQAFVPGRSMSVTAVVQQGRIVAAAARETLSFDPIAGGTSVWKRTVPPTTSACSRRCSCCCRWATRDLPRWNIKWTQAAPRG